VTTDRDTAPTRTIEPMDAPPDAARPTTAMLKGDVDSGRTGDKNPVFDPGLSPLGTDDEAAGHPPSAHRVAIARRSETVWRWAKGSRKAGAAHHKHDGVPVVFMGFILAVAVALVLGLWMFAAGFGPVRA
jgi:hypothetical protein